MKINTTVLKAVARTAQKKISEALVEKKTIQEEEFKKTADYKKLLKLNDAKIKATSDLQEFATLLEASQGLSISTYNTVSFSIKRKSIPDVDAIYDELVISAANDTDIETMINNIIDKYSN